MIKNAPRRSSYYFYTILFVSLLLITAISIKSLSNNESNSIVDTKNYDISGIYESATVQDSTVEDENPINDEANLVSQTNRANAVSPISNLVVTQQAGVAGPAPVNLGAAGIFAILTKSGISTTGNTSIVGNIGVSPIASTAITGFGLIADPSNTFATSSLVTGRVYAADYAPPTPVMMTAAVSDMETAYTDAAGRTNPTATELGAGNIDGMTLTQGLYKWSTGVTIPSNVTLAGGVNDVWIFQIAGDLTVGNDAIITLSGGAQARNIFWQVAGQATLGTNSVSNGNILSANLIALNAGATLNGRALAQTAVTLIANSVSIGSSLNYFLMGTDQADALFGGTFNSTAQTLIGEVLWSNSSIRRVGVGSYAPTGQDSGFLSLHFSDPNNINDLGLNWTGTYGQGRWVINNTQNPTVTLNGRVFQAPN